MAPTPDKFWSRVTVGTQNECWLWRGPTDKDGYGQCRQNGKQLKAHRVAYQLTYDVDPSHLFVCHSCDCPQCCNPNHLFLGTAKDNAEDMINKGRGNHNFKAGHTFSRGQANRTAVLTPEKVKEIRNLVASGRTHASVAKEYNVQEPAVYKIVHRRTWAHVA